MPVDAGCTFSQLESQAPGRGAALHLTSSTASATLHRCTLKGNNLLDKEPAASAVHVTPGSGVAISESDFSHCTISAGDVPAIQPCVATLQPGADPGAIGATQDAQVSPNPPPPPPLLSPLMPAFLSCAPGFSSCRPWLFQRTSVSRCARGAAAGSKNAMCDSATAAVCCQPPMAAAATCCSNWRDRWPPRLPLCLCSAPQARLRA